MFLKSALRLIFSVIVASSMIGCSRQARDQNATYGDIDMSYSQSCDMPPRWVRGGPLPPGKKEEDRKREAESSLREYYVFTNVGSSTLTDVQITLYFVGSDRKPSQKAVTWNEWENGKSQTVSLSPGDNSHVQVDLDGTAMLDGKKVMLKAVFIPTPNAIRRDWKRK